MSKRFTSVKCEVVDILRNLNIGAREGRAGIALARPGFFLVGILEGLP